jgi:hypothetical protein
MRLPAFEFAQAVDEAIVALPREDYYLRKGRAKRLLEELYPLSRFALHLVHPGSRIEVEAPEDDGPYDGLIHRGEQLESTLSVQVTYVHSYEEALRRELLWKTGSAPGTGPIRRDKATREIVATNQLVSVEQEIDRLASDIVALHEKKCKKGYRRGAILIVAFDDPTFWGRHLWAMLIAAVNAKSNLRGGGFSEVHFFNCGSNELQADT